MPRSTDAKHDSIAIHARRGILFLALFILGLGSGCRAFRAELGGGLGFGAEIKLPYVLHTGFGMQKYKYLGLDYDQGLRVGREDGYWEFSGSMVIFHQEELHDRLVTMQDYRQYSGYTEVDYEYARKNPHLCPGVAPYLFDDHDHSRSTPLEIRLHALFLGIRLGFDPTKLGTESAVPDGSPDADAPGDSAEELSLN